MRGAVTFALASILSLTGILIAPRPDAMVLGAPGGRPDIVLWYLDDAAQHPLRLWNNSTRTPELGRFVNNGVRFANAISTSPMCGPSRASLLTGHYPHTHGVVHNDIGAYTPSADTLGPRMRSTGYKSVFIGKHMNLLRQRYPTAKSMGRLASHWSAFDVIWENGGRYYDWDQYRKGGTIKRYGKGEKNHSTYQAVQRAVHHIRNTPTTKPIFLLMSLFDGHEPITPLPRFRNDQRCRSVTGWFGGSYNEWDVSDKPRYVRRLPRLKAYAFNLRTRCTQQLTVDWAMTRVRKALEAKGRWYNSMHVLTSDNGYLLGDHRIVGKTPPYSTPVPLMIRWPKALGTRKRTVLEPVSTVDLPVTFCAIAGCTIPRAEGLDITPLIKGTRSRLDRAYLYVEMQNGRNCYRSPTYYRPEWSGVETTRQYSETLWAYTRYKTGEEELYNISKDRHRKQNLVTNMAGSKVLRDVRAFRNETWQRNGVRWCIGQT